MRRSESALYTAFSEDKQLTQTLSALRSTPQPAGLSPHDTFSALFSCLGQCEHRQRSFTSQLEKVQTCFRTVPNLPDNTGFQRLHAHYYEHLSVYHLFRYFMDCAWSCEPLLQVQHIALACLSVYALSLNQWLENGRSLSEKEHQAIFCAYSREIEHSIPNQALLSDHLTLDLELSAPALTGLLMTFP